MRVRLRIKEIALQKGITNAFQLHKATGLTYAVCHLYFDKEPKQITTDAMQKLSTALKCNPCDLFEVKK